MQSRFLSARRVAFVVMTPSAASAVHLERPGTWICCSIPFVDPE